MTALILLVLACVRGGPAQAHKPSDSYLTVSAMQASPLLEGQWDIALRDLDRAVGLDRNGDGAITWGELKVARAAVFAYALSHLEAQAIARGERAACPLVPGALLFDEHVDGGYAVLRFALRCPFRPAELAVRYALLFELDPNHRGLIDVRSPAGTQAYVLASDARDVVISLAAANRAAQFGSFTGEGIWHIWKGYDHLLFLLTLLLPAVVVYSGGRWHPRESLHEATVDILKVVTAFTLAHSITLTLAVCGAVRVPSRPVESLIALTVLLGALNNLVPAVRERRWAVAFCFGLIHGLGFASVLADLGLRGADLALALTGFNIGVEIGQLTLVLAFVPLAFLLRGTLLYRHAVMPLGALSIAAVAVYWLALRLSGAALQ